jgi:hypothetical protein
MFICQDVPQPGAPQVHAEQLAGVFTGPVPPSSIAAPLGQEGGAAVPS